MKPTVAFRSFLLASIVFSASPALHAAIYYWDDNAEGTGFGTAGASTGTWAGPTAGPTAGWSLSATGANAFAGFTTGTADTVNFGTNTASFGLGAGTITVSGTVSANKMTFGSQSGAIELSGGTQITMGGSIPTITVNNAQDTISAKIVNTTAGNNAGLTKSGAGELVLSGTGNSIAGEATTGANGVGIRLSAGTLTVSGGGLATATAGKGIGTFSGDTGNFKQTGGTVTVNATGNLIVGWNSASAFTLSGGTTSAANIIHKDSGDGVITISGTNTTTVGNVEHNTNNTAGSDSLTVNLNSGGTLATNSLLMTLGAAATTTGTHSLNVNFDGGMLKARSTANLIAATPAGTSTRAVNVVVKSGGALIDTSTFTATILQPLLHDSGLGATADGGLTKSGTGTLVLSAANTYTGATTVSAGILAVNGSLANTSTTVGNLATLRGNGTIGGAVTVEGGGILAPGNSIESLGTGAMSFLTGSTYAYELQTSLFAGTPNVSADLTYSTGTLDIAAGAFLTLTDLATSTVLAGGSKLTLISYDGGWTSGELFTYNATPLNDGATFMLGANQWRFDYNDTFEGVNYAAESPNGKSYVTMTVVPEPSAALLGGLGLLFLLRRRRN